MTRSASILFVILTAGAAVGVSSLQVRAEPQQRSRVISRPAPEKEKTGAERRGAPEKSAGPMEVFSDIERGWRENNVDLILQHFGESKVSISIAAGPSGGKFSRSQSFYLLKDMFKYTITKKFEFVQYRKPNESGKSSFAVAERLYQRTDDGRLFKDKIYVSLHSDGGETWVVNEIKSIR